MAKTWYDRLRVVNVGEHLRDTVDHLLENCPPEKFGAEMFEPNSFELSAIAAAASAVGSECRDLGVRDDDGFEITFGVTTREEMNRTAGDHAGLAGLREFILCRELEPPDFLHTAMHELTHANSFLSVELHEVGGGGGAPSVFVHAARFGLTFTRRDGDHLYRLLDEAVTDIVAHRAAVRLRDDVVSCDLPRDVLREAADSWGYREAAYLVGDLCRIVAPEFGGSAEALRALMRDYFTGTCTFLPALKRREPRAPRLLAEMSPDRAGVLAVAVALGRTEVIKKFS